LAKSGIEVQPPTSKEIAINITVIMKQGFFIREYVSSDYPEMLSLWESLGLGGAHRGDDEQIILRTIKMGGQLLMMIDKESASIVGTSWLTVDGRRTYLHHFGIHADYQGHGLSNILLDASLKLAKSYGMQIKLEVHKDNAKALGLYQKAGFACLGDYLVYIIRDISVI
jgi:ribosomal protein S18 acetylase RimI-like enzyme